MKAQTFRMTLTAQGPVSIGSGEEISKKEYVFFPEKWRIVVMAMPKLYALAQKKNLGSFFEDFLCPPPGRRRNQDLGSWICKNRISGKELDTCVRYILPTGAIETSRNYYNVWAFVKDPYGKPYVPGSSVKGMLRTVLLTARLWQNHRAWQAEIDALKSGRGNRNNYLKREIDTLEARAFRTLGRPGTRREDAVNDELSGLIGSEVYLGGNAGFATKTVIYAALGRQVGIQTIRQIFRQTKVPRNHHHERDQKVSPHIVKCARYGGKLYEFGKCRLAIE